MKCLSRELVLAKKKKENWSQQKQTDCSPTELIKKCEASQTIEGKKRVSFAFCLTGKITAYLQTHGINTAEKENYLMQKEKLPK